VIEVANSTYVMSDLHGHFSKFIKMLRYIQFDSTDNMLILGNVVNIGPQPIELLMFISQQDNIKMSLGRHEIIMLQAILENDLQIFDGWINSLDGRYTYDLYNQLTEDKKHYILNYLKESCVSFFTAENFVLSSAGLFIWQENEFTNLKTEKPTFEEVLKRAENNNGYLTVDPVFFQKAGLKDKIIIFGDVPVQKIRESTRNYKIWHDPIYNDKICVNSGINIKPYKLACLRLNDMREFYI